MMTSIYPSGESVPVYIHGCGFTSALGIDHDEIHTQLRADQASSRMVPVSGWLNNGRDTVIGKAVASSEPFPADLVYYESANNRLAMTALLQIKGLVDEAIEKYGKDRVAVITGTSTSGIADGESALEVHAEQGEIPATYHYRTQEVGNLGDFVADFLGVTGPVYTVSTACSSSGRVFISAQRMLKAGLVDAVVVGGSDSLCRLTLNGFNGLEALSDTLCNPFSENRKGINIGEAAAFMLLSLQKDTTETQDLPIALLGAGDSSDAHHISAPHPEGKGAEEAMRKALNDAGLAAEQIGYINAHGTATPLNDQMEAKAIHRVFGDTVPVSSTKPLTGHTLGAASAVEAAIIWHLLRYQLPLPKQVNDGNFDGEIAPICLVEDTVPLTKPAILSNSFAFGGNNVSLIFGYTDG